MNDVIITRRAITILDLIVTDNVYGHDVANSLREISFSIFAFAYLELFCCSLLQSFCFCMYRANLQGVFLK